MFRTLARLISAPGLTTAPTPAELVRNAGVVFATHPIQLSRWLDEIWANGGIAAWPGTPPGGPGLALGDADIVPRLALPAGLRDDTLRSGIRPTPPFPLPPGFAPAISRALGVDFGPLPWEHLFYGFLVECTGIVDIMAEVVRRYVVGETLPTPNVDTLVWIRNTEELFFRDPPLFHIGGLTSQLRPSAEINRRNAYWRAFGCDLPHPPRSKVDGQPWKRDTGSGANTRFIELWNELLRQVWIGIENDTNQVGANPTDSTYVGYLCQSIGELLRLRRRGGTLAREEYAYVTMLSWFHLTVEFDTALVNTLSAQATGVGNPADRLAGIGNHVGITPPRHARELFELADIVSPVLWFIELDLFTQAPNAELLYRRLGGANPAIPLVMTRIVDLWQSATGEPVKDQAVAVRLAKGAARAAQPVRLPTATGSPSLPQTPARAEPSPNGRSAPSRV